MGGGKGGGSTQNYYSSGASTVSIPPEVLARYNAVNTRAEQAAAAPFKEYGGEFVAPINPVQQGGIDAIAGAAGSWSPYYANANSTLGAGLGAANTNLAAGIGAGTGLANTSLGFADRAGTMATPYNTTAGGYYNNAYAGAQPYNRAAAGLALAGINAVNPGELNTSAYMNPHMSSVIDPTVAQMQNLFGQQQRDLKGNQILSGTFGSDRGGIGRAVLSNQQGLALGQTVGGLYNQNYAQALGAAQQQQGVGLAAAQANRAALQGGAGQLLGIGGQSFGQGIGAGQAQQGLGNQVFGQNLGLAGQYLNTGNTLFNQGNTAAGTYGNLGIGGAGAYSGLGNTNLANQLTQGQAQIGAGTVTQQTQQAQNQALYNQFLQQQGYPFQVAQFLAGIAEGTGALSGSTTTTSGGGGGYAFQPQPFFSDERLKDNIKVVGATHDGIPIVSFRYKGSPSTQIGLLAQDVEKHRPDAVGLDSGYKTVDYDAATRLHRPANDDTAVGLVPARRSAHASGGVPDMSEILAVHQAMYPGAVNARGIGTGPRGMQLRPSSGATMLQGPKVEIQKPDFGHAPTQTGLGQAVQGVNTAMETGKNVGNIASAAQDAIVGRAESGTPGTSGYKPATGGLIGSGGKWSGQGWIDRQIGSGSSAGSTTSSPSGVSPASAPSTSSLGTPATNVSSLVSSSTPTPDATSSTGFSGGTQTADLIPLLDDPVPSFAARGGRIRRAAGGLLPYDPDAAGEDSYVPEPDRMDPTALMAQQKGLAGTQPYMASPNWQGMGGSGGSSGGSFGDMLKGAGQVAALAMMFLKRGGRATFADGGDTELAELDPNAKPVPRPFGGRPQAQGLKPVDTSQIVPPPASSDAWQPPVVPADPAAEVQDAVRRERGLALPPRPAQPASGLAPGTPAAPPATRPSPSVVPPQRRSEAPAGTQDAMLDRIEPAVATIETSPHPDQGWSTIGVETTYPNGTKDRPYGKFGVMGNNVGPWTEKWAGRRMTPQEFLADRDAQRAVLRGQMGEYVQQFGSPQRAFGAWFAGPAGIDSKKEDVLGTSVPWYIKRATALYNGEPDPGARDPNKSGRSTMAIGPGSPSGPGLPVQPSADPSQTSNGLVPAGGIDPSGTLDPLTGRSRKDPNAGFFDQGGFLDRNQREIATGLTFLGNMLASPSRTLAGSIGSGLAAAAPAYLQQANREQVLGQSQQGIGQEQQRITITERQQMMSIWAQLLSRRAEIINQGLPVPPELNQQITAIEARLSQFTSGPGGNAKPVSPTQVQFTPPGGGGGGTGGGPITSAPVAPINNTSPTQKPGDVVQGPSTAGSPGIDKDGLPIVNTTDQNFLGQIDPRFNPHEITKRANQLALAGAPNAGQVFQEARAAADKIAKEGGAPDRNGNFIWAPGGKERMAAEKRIPINEQLIQEEASSAKSRQVMKSSLLHIASALERFETGDFAGAKAEIAGKLKAIGFDPGTTATMSPTEFQTMLKNAFFAVTQQAPAGPGTDALRAMIERAVPSTEYQPEANKRILAQMLGVIERDDKLGRKFTHDVGINRSLDSAAWRQKELTEKDNDVKALEDRIYSDLGVRGATPDKLQDLQPGHVYIIEPNQLRKYGIEPGKYGPTDRPIKVRWVKGPDGGHGWTRVQ